MNERASATGWTILVMCMAIAVLGAIPKAGSAGVFIRSAACDDGYAPNGIEGVQMGSFTGCTSGDPGVPASSFPVASSVLPSGGSFDIALGQSLTFDFTAASSSYSFAVDFDLTDFTETGIFSPEGNFAPNVQSSDNTFTVSSGILAAFGIDSVGSYTSYLVVHDTAAMNGNGHTLGDMTSFTINVSEALTVPEPAGLAAMSVGLLYIAAVRRRRRQAKPPARTLSHG